jgi:hypothetical protein
MPFKSALD